MTNEKAARERNLRAVMESYDAEVIGADVAEPARLCQLIDFCAGMNGALAVVEECIKRGEDPRRAIQRLGHEGYQLYLSLNPEHYRKRTDG